MKKPFKFRPKDVDLLKRAALQPGEEPGGEACAKALLNRIAELETQVADLKRNIGLLEKICEAQGKNIDILMRAVMVHDAELAALRKPTPAPTTEGGS